MFSKLNTLVTNRLFQTLLVLGLYIVCADLLPLNTHQTFYTISLFIKDLLLWMMPLTVGFFIANTIQSFEGRAGLFILVLVMFEAISNMSCVWYAFATATGVASELPSIAVSQITEQLTQPWRLPLIRPTWWSAQNGVLVGVLFGLTVGMSKNPALINFSKVMKQYLEWILTKIFSRLIPLFVLGFAAQIYQSNLLGQILSTYSLIVFWLILFLAVYLLIVIAIGADFSPKKMIHHIKNLLPAGAIALTSSCSMSTMPWTIQGTAKNLKDPELANAIIPATTNIQQIGDCFANAFLCFLIYRHFFGYNPDLSTWATFSFFFVVARFATAAVLGGAIFIMLPLYESYLNFTGEMIALILALNVVLDPLITSTNVIANGALSSVFEKVWLKMQMSLNNFAYFKKLKTD